jgi:hypothetical protein
LKSPLWGPPQPKPNESHRIQEESHVTPPPPTSTPPPPVINQPNENSGQVSIQEQMRLLRIKIDEKDEEYQNIGNSNRLKKLNARKELNKLRVEYNKLKNQL